MDNLQDQWFLVDPRTLLENIASTTASGYEESLNAILHQQDDVHKNVITALASRNIVRFKNNPESTKLNGTAVYKYTFTIDPDQLVQAFIAIGEMNAGQRITAQERAVASQIKDYMQFDTGEVWVGAKDSLPYQILLKMSVVDPTQHAFSGTVAAQVTFRDYNRPVAVTIPSSAKPIDQVIQEMMSASSAGNAPRMNAPKDARATSRDAHRIADVRELQLGVELYFDANNGSYPKKLSELVPTYISQIPTPPQPSTAPTYFYVPLSAAGGLCTTGICSSYHLGAALEDPNNRALITDADFDTHLMKGGFAGRSHDCGKKTETTDTCFDVRP